MTQASLFKTTPKVRETGSPMAKAAAAFQRDNIECARRALADPIRFDYLQGWARLVLQKNGLLSESESV